MTTGKDQTKQFEKWRLVDSKDALVVYRSFRFWKWVLVAMLPAIAAIVVRASTNYAAGPIIGGAFLALGITALLVHSFLRRGIISNMGVFLRDSDPIPYWLSIVFLLLFYVFSILVILKASTAKQVMDVNLPKALQSQSNVTQLRGDITSNAK